MPARLNFPADDDAMRRVGPFVLSFVAEHRIAEEDRARIFILLEELVTNLQKHGYPTGPRGRAEIALTLDGNRLVIDFTDDGAPFDPFAQAPSDPEAAVAQRAVGELGLGILKSWSHETQYRRRGGRNRVRLIRLIELELQAPFEEPA